MKKPAYFPLRLALMWMVIFIIARVGFLFLLFNEGYSLHSSVWPFTFLYGVRLDISTIAYLTGIPYLIWLIYCLSKKSVFLKLLHFINALLLFTVLSILFSNYAIYRSWGTLLNARAISFLRDPEGIIASITTFQLIFRTAMLFLLFYLLFQFYLKHIVGEAGKFNNKISLLPSFISLLIIPLALRGGWQEIPINESSSFFSEEMAMNHAATNPVWYLSNSINKSSFGEHHPYQFMSQSAADQRFNALLLPDKQSPPVLLNRQPNIILIVLESWTADIIEPLGGETGVTPFFNSLCDSGILFNNIYSSGRRTDQMFPSILSGFPSQPNHSLSRFTDKIRKLPMLSSDLKKAGYKTSFYYGGELGFANMNTYLLNGEFNQITGKDEFNKSEMNSKWGAHDEFIFKKLLDDNRSKVAPFFSMLLTLSTHEPFEVPGSHPFSGDSEPMKFRNAAHYTDQCIKNFLEAASKKEWYKNTLFIFVADHGHPLPKKRDYYDPACYHIPLLWYGPAISPEYRGKIISTAGGQHELALTILNQLHINSGKYIFSNDLFSGNTQKGIYLNYDEGFGWKEGDEQFVYLFGEGRYLQQYTHLSSPTDSSIVLNGKSFLQTLYSRFLEL